MLHPLSIAMFNWREHLPWVAAGVIVLLGLVLYGWRDLLRLDVRRIWAISGVCYLEAIRKRILWVTPLALIGVIVVSQLSTAIDPQDAIRQATKFCLFASGMLVTIVAVILACTNLPREIENRVIYTIVTKPTTRLEIVLGKVVGFARISGAILLIMGIFTYAYLRVRAWSEMAALNRELAAMPADSPARPNLAYYKQIGFLNTKSLAGPSDLQVYSRVPSGSTRWIAGAEGEYFVVPFKLDDEQRAELEQVRQQNGAAFLMTTLHIDQKKPDADDLKLLREMGLETGPIQLSFVPLGPPFPPPIPATQPATRPSSDLPPVQVRVRLLDQSRKPIIGTADEGSGMLVTMLPPDQPEGSWYGRLELNPQILDALSTLPVFFAQITAYTPATEYGVDAKPIIIFVPTRDGGIKIDPAPDPKNPSETVMPAFLSFPGRKGMRLQSRAAGKGPLAYYQFHNVAIDRPKSDNVALQVRLNIEKNGEFASESGESSFAQVSIETVNSNTGQTSGQRIVTPELGRTIYLDVPYGTVSGGNFDVIVRGLTRGQWLGVNEGSIALVTADASFLINLAKSLLMLWLLSLLVVIIAVFCSTFLSWPIAVVCTLVILLGHWGVEQLGDAIAPGVGHNIVTEMKVQNLVASQAVDQTVEKLSRGLQIVSRFLPDVGKFPATEDIERGVSIPRSSIWGALGVLACYGIPLLVFSYVIMRNKEVAP